MSKFSQFLSLFKLSKLIGLLSILFGISSLFAFVLFLISSLSQLRIDDSLPDPILKNGWPFFGISLLLCVALSIILGIVSRKKEEGNLGTIGLILGSIVVVIGLLLVCVGVILVINTSGSFW